MDVSSQNLKIMSPFILVSMGFPLTTTESSHKHSGWTTISLYAKFVSRILPFELYMAGKVSNSTSASTSNAFLGKQGGFSIAGTRLCAL